VHLQRRFAAGRVSILRENAVGGLSSPHAVPATTRPIRNGVTDAGRSDARHTSQSATWQN
jgi:hypothetical protein